MDIVNKNIRNHGLRQAFDSGFIEGSGRNLTAVYHLHLDIQDRIGNPSTRIQFQIFNQLIHFKISIIRIKTEVSCVNPNKTNMVNDGFVLVKG